LNDNVEVIEVERDTGLLSSDEKFNFEALEVIPITLDDQEVIDNMDIINPV
jgi:hypothetical protein